MDTGVDTFNLWDKIQFQFEEYSPLLIEGLTEVSDHIKQQLRSKNISCTVKKRLKGRNSFYAKLKKSYKENPEDDYPLTDLLGIRIIVPFLEDVQHVVDEFREAYEILEREDKKDNLSFREFSYDSTHLLIPFPWEQDYFIHGNQKVIEIQIRTTLQDAWAEVEHQLIYKTQVNYPNESVKRKMASLNANLTLSDIVFQEIRDNQKNLLEESKSRMEMIQHKVVASNLLPSLTPDNSSLSLEESFDLSLLDELNFEKLLQKALALHTQKNYNQAILVYKKAIEKGVDKKALSITYHHLGMAYFMISYYDSAIENFNLAISYNPKNDRAYLNRGIIFQLMKETEKAIEDFTISLDLKHDQIDAWLHLSSCYLSRFDYSEALIAVNTAATLEKENPRVKLLQAEISTKLIP